MISEIPGEVEGQSYKHIVSQRLAVGGEGRFLAGLNEYEEYKSKGSKDFAAEVTEYPRVRCVLNSRASHLVCDYVAEECSSEGPAELG